MNYSQNLKSRLLKLCSFTALVFLSVSNISATEVNSIRLDTVTNETTSSIAATPVSKQKIFIVEQSLPDFLRQAARRNGYEITMSSRVRGTLKKMSLPVNMEKMLTKIAPQFDLKWHFQEKQLYVSLGSENSTRMIFLGETNMKDLEQALDGAGLKSKAYDLNYIEESNSVIINGSVSYIASVELIAEALSKNQSIQRDKLKIIRFGKSSKQ